jgi:uncharacterized SAM-binding protein YcdF (DUF218 family)
MTISNEVSEKPKKQKSHPLRACLINILSIVALIFLVWLLGAGLIVSQPLKPVDAIVVLSGGKADRLAEGIKLFEAGLASRIILTKTGTDLLDPETQWDIVKQYAAVNLGVPPEDVIVTQNTANSTVEEAEAVLHEMRSYGYTSCILVTDSFHTLRSEIIFKQAFRGKGITLIMHAVPVDWFHRSNWWTTSQGWSTAISEWIKLIGYLLGVRQN